MIKYISLDLELEQPKTNPNTPDSHLDEEKIIQVGYVVYSVTPFKVYEKQCYHIHLDYPLSDYIQKLTGITNNDLRYGMTIHQVYDALVSTAQQHGTIRGIIQWGSGDIEAMRKELGDQVKWEFAKCGINIKHMYQMWARANNKNPSGGLKTSMKRIGIKFEGKAHNALNDAYNTALMHNKLMEILGRDQLNLHEKMIT